MSVEFQNGFLCGMATKGMLRTENQYEPKIWNDSGVFTYFYVDFKRSLEEFSLGMLRESIVLHDSIQFEIKNFEYSAPGIYKVYCDLSDKTKGVTLINKAASLLNFASGRKVPPFSTMFYVAGLGSMVRKAYAYETTPLKAPAKPATAEAPITSYIPYQTVPITEGAALSTTTSFETNETTDVSYGGV